MAGLTAPELTAAELTGVGLGAAFAAWGDATRRDLPWRRTRDPWAVLVSEVMLQQTQVARVVPRYQEWMDRWPAPPDLAGATVGEAIAAWSGLGYNRRAVNLHRCAGAVVERFGGVVPDRLEDLLTLPGVGAYTARAVLAFAFERSVGVVDVNAARVLARTAGRPLTASEVQRRADPLTPVGGGWAHNQAVLDLGATVCTARAPRCGSCPLPVAGGCRWHAAGGPSAAPDPAARTAGTGRRQGTFAGSDRQGRGRLVATLRHGPLRRSELAAAAGWPEDPSRTARVAAALVAEGLARRTPGGGLDLPGPVRTYPDVAGSACSPGCVRGDRWKSSSMG